MFTGLIQAVGRIERIEPSAAGVRLSVDPGGWTHRPAPGDSIAVNGVCLTVATEGASIGFDVITETLRRSTLGGLEAGSRVNLEHAARADTLLGGHIVQGHVDGVGEVTRSGGGAEDWRLAVRVGEELMDYIAEKGSVAIVGVSLTVAGAGRDGFEVALIPVTLERTTLGSLRAGDRVNIETDIIA
ncbi:MAG: riboflavin synthase, partial [Planctomycetota bacterium]|nr:riboflavin synthase [Planctomycetota bacterium]